MSVNSTKYMLDKMQAKQRVVKTVEPLVKADELDEANAPKFGMPNLLAKCMPQKDGQKLTPIK